MSYLFAEGYVKDRAYEDCMRQRAEQICAGVGGVISFDAWQRPHVACNGKIDGKYLYFLSMEPEIYIFNESEINACWSGADVLILQ